MTVLLDTCICIFLIRGKSETVRERFADYKIGDLGISSVTEAELRYGAEKSAAPEKNHLQLDRFFLTLPVLSFDSSAAKKYGTIRMNLERKGTPIGPYDLMIAAHALALGLRVATNNVGEFERVPDLAVEDWK